MKTETATLKVKDLRNFVRRKGFSISGWARKEGFNRRTVEAALKGEINGKLSKEIRMKAQNLKGI